MNRTRNCGGRDRSSRRAASAGFTLVELTATLAVIGMLLAILLPAILHVREAARRVQCENNLKQMGVALHSFHDTRGAFPPGWNSIQLSEDGSILRPADLGCLWAWSAYLLPQLDQAPLHDTLGVLGVSDPPPAGATLDVRLNVFVCPSDASGPESGWGLYRWEGIGQGLSATLVKGYAKSNYAAVNGRGAVPFRLVDAPPEPYSPETGIFGNETRTRIQDIRDGASHTFAVGEREMTRRYGKVPPRGAVWIRNVGELMVGIDGDPFAPGVGVQGLRRQAMGPVLPVAAIHCNAHSVVGVTNEQVPLNRTSFGFSSLHTGGAYFLFADGRVRFISDGIDASTYEALGSMADGRCVSEF